MVKRFENIGSLSIEELVAILETYNVEMIRDEQKVVGYNKPMRHALAAPISSSSTSSYGYSPSPYAQTQYYQHSPTPSTQTQYPSQSLSLISGIKPYVPLKPQL